MTAATQGLPLPGTTWETFAITEVRWLLAALAWSLALLVCLAALPWLFTGYGLVLALALLAAVATAYAIPGGIPALPAPTVLRYALVDAVFVAFTVHPLFLGAQIVLASAGVAPRTVGGPFALVPPAIFVLAFYACLGAIGHARASASALRWLPLGAAAVVAALVVPAGHRRYAEYAALQKERQAGVAAYERTTGKRAGELDRLRIGNSLHGFDNRVHALAMDREGRLLAAGDFAFYAGQDARGLVRLLPDGRLDRSFAAMPPGDPALFAPTRLLVASDGSVVLNNPLPGQAPGVLSRLSSDGALDPRFQPVIEPGRAPHDPLEAMDLQADGRLVLAPRAGTEPRAGEGCVMRLGADGSRDAAFEAAAREALFGREPAQQHMAFCSVSMVAVLASGQLLVEGAFPAIGPRRGLARLNADGTLDAAYRSERGDFEASRWAVTPAGEYFAVAHVPVAGATPPAYVPRFLKLRADGRLDASFAPPPGLMARVDRIAVQPDGKLILAGSLGAGDYGAIVRVLPDGRRDPAFGGGEGVARVNGFLTAIVVQPDGRIVLAGEFLAVAVPGKARGVERFHIARLNADGSLDASFDPR